MCLSDAAVCVSSALSSHLCVFVFWLEHREEYLFIFRRLEFLWDILMVKIV